MSSETTTHFRRHDPLTQRIPRTLQEIEDDGFAWWRAAEAEAANEEFIRSQFNGDEIRQQPRRSRVASLLLILIAVCLLAAWRWHA